MNATLRFAPGAGAGFVAELDLAAIPETVMVEQHSQKLA
jgi:hypothetical protein